MLQWQHQCINENKTTTNDPVAKRVSFSPALRSMLKDASPTGAMSEKDREQAATNSEAFYVDVRSSKDTL